MNIDHRAELPGIRPPNMTHLFDAHRSDKGYRHGYGRYYDPLFAAFQSRPVRFLEIGVASGNSMKVWQEYFANAELVFGIGYGKRAAFQTPEKMDCSASVRTYARRKSNGNTTCTLFKGDQSDTAFLKTVKEESGGRFDIIIDDGSHVPSHQLISFEYLWPSIAPGGIYVIEDIETSYWKASGGIYGYSLSHEKSFVAHMKRVVDTINREFTLGKSGLPRIYSDISEVAFGHDIIIVKKQTRAEAATFFNRGRRYWIKGVTDGTQLPYP